MSQVQPTDSLKSLLEPLPRPERLRLLTQIQLDDEEAAFLEHQWRLLWARPEQVLPDGDWPYWVVLAGRGWGKTRTGAEAVHEWAERGEGPIHLIGRTAADVRDVMVEGISGIMRTAKPWFMPKYEPSKTRITWPNGVEANLFSAEEPDSLRGPQCARAWLDELAAWERLQATFEQFEFGFRLPVNGTDPQAIITTTPRPLKIVRDLMVDNRNIVTRGRTRDNYANLSAKFVNNLEAKYGGTRLGRQELDGEILDDIPGALWTMEMIAENRRDVSPETLPRVCIAIDPPVTSGENADECGIIAAACTGIGPDEHAYVLEDASEQGLTPRQWADKAVRAYKRHNADCIVAEVNNGGDLIEDTIHNVDPRIRVVKVRATRGKAVRAEPVAMLYEQGRVHHVGDPKKWTKLEDQMRQIVPDFDASKAGFSPDRVDALVWALTHLMLGEAEFIPGIRSL